MLIQVWHPCYGASVPDILTECPKCGAFSGDDWTQCKGMCPMESSPHYNADLAAILPEPSRINRIALLESERMQERCPGHRWIREYSPIPY